MRKKLRLLAVGFFLLLAAVVTLICFRSYDTFPWERFDQQKWLAYNSLPDGNQSDCYRGPMVFSLRHYYLKSGMDYSTVRKLLGKPDLEKDGCLHYTLGMCSGLGMDFDSLNISFDDERHLTKSFTEQH